MGEYNSAGEQGRGPIAHRLDHLIRTLHPRDRGPYTYQEIADSIREQAGPDDPTVSHGTIHSLHKGKVTNPSVDTLRALGKFFGVGAKYFLDDEVAARTDARIKELREGADRAEAGRELADALEDKQVKAVAFRLRGLSAAALRGITSIVDGARQAEGLPRVDRTPVPGPAVGPGAGSVPGAAVGTAAGPATSPDHPSHP
ncbi:MULTISPECIES: helix-turn-helix domain-containing protein [unclassified Streptomyces]|uniref:helix-turn-helix domain-containing protein n=1 Tax=unclassified Streptomyces TaxID=2593676 RepID=UPI002E3219E9|nr:MULTISPECIES: helix-turn-helix domain-containing protein [unclassified Streptomyces]WUC69024.1 helix-turn-helix domain-containing protein [Streptomyces sp. NBC_00539]